MNIEFILLIFASALASYRITMLFHEEDGPWDVFDWVRFKVGIIPILLNDEIIDYRVDDQNKLRMVGRIISCKKCLSGYITLFLSLISLTDSLIVYAFVLWLASWTLVVLMNDLKLE